ncbi:hypothetical protein B0E45_32235 [Sinorhizobium sp. A49]|uniref:hypothetical protein n=1 Tax=Sinorhizobium sp. A49 TaxID=1945861 RepID=UPI00098557D5|nr:hypothetical protein [Sinorhizobium sp. A49]OOG61808.1 hypothetical protein B0E45_32235 [Sinorhizobium sp. A49]
MVFNKAIARGVVALSLVVTLPIGGMVGVAGTALAKDGHGNSGGGGGSGNGNGGSHGGGSGSSHGKSEAARANKDSRSNKASDKSTLKSFFTRDKSPETTRKPAKADKLAKAEPVGAGVGTPGLRSLNRNYHAYINSNDPRMAAVSAYAMAYAEFEAENGVDAIPSDPALSDEALRDALASFTKDGIVTDEVLDEAKDILGVGPEVGKIDQIRDTLPPPTVD